MSSGRPNSPRHHFIEDGFGAVAHELAHTLWLPHDTRQDARDFLALAAQLSIRIHTERYDLADANRALTDLRAGRVKGAAVLVPAV